MAIYGIGYRLLEYRQTPMPARLWAIAALEYRTLFRRRAGVLLLLACLLPALFNLGVMMLFMGVLQLGLSEDYSVRLAAINPRMNPSSIEFFLIPLLVEAPSLLVFLVLTTLVSCRAIAKDRDSNGLELYWTRCVEPGGYFLAKWLGSFLLVGTVFVAAPMAIWSIGVLTAPDWSYFTDTVAFVPSLLLGLTIFTAGLTWIAVVLSAVAPSAKVAVLLWLGLLLGTMALGEMLAELLHGAWWCQVISPWNVHKRVAEWICGYTPPEDYPAGWAIAAVVAWWVVLGAGLRAALRRGRAVG